MRSWFIFAAFLIASTAAPVRSDDYLVAAPDSLRVGHWVEVRGQLEDNGVFEADRLEMVEPDRYEVLLGTIEQVDGRRHFEILGQRVELNEKTVFRDVDPEALVGQRVKLQGYFLGEGQFSSRKIYARNPGRDRIAGRIDSIRLTDQGVYRVRVMDYTVNVPAGTEVRFEGAMERYPTSPPRALAVVDRNRDEEDLFGTGFWLSDRLFLAGQFEGVAQLEDDFDLNDRLPRKRDEVEARLRARVVYQPSDYFFAVATVSYQQSWRDDQRRGRLDERELNLSETYLYFLDPFDNGLSLQLGRVDFDESREWLYDQDLDTIRAVLERGDFRAELSYSETLFDGSVLDESARNGILYLSNTDDDRHIAGYVVHRDYDLPVPARQTNYGFRAHGEWLPNHETWLEIAGMEGKTGSITQRGWAVDIGTTWNFYKRFSLTAGYAFGRGDDSGTEVNETFRQTGLHDNNDRFGGVTSFRYYGELIDPELANLQITTLGLGWKSHSRVSLDLVWHTYRQDVASRFLVDTQLRSRPNGMHKDLGQELDLILGWRTSNSWDLEVIAAWFDPGRAFFIRDPALLGKVQFRYRF